MKITRNSLETNVGPSDWFTGPVYVDTVATAAPFVAPCAPRFRRRKAPT